MFERLLDALSYEQQFQKWLRSFDFPIKLEGCRVAELHNQSPSTGQPYDVELLRHLYYEKLPQALYWGKNSREPSKSAAFRFLYTLLDAYAAADPRDGIREVFAFNVGLAARLTNGELPKQWKDAIDADHARYRQRRAALDARLPTLVAARQVGQKVLLRNADLLDQHTVPTEGLKVWQALPETFVTEWDLHVTMALPLSDICEWLPVFASRELVAVVGTALDEPKYRRLPREPSHPTNRATFQWLEAQRDVV
jgi:hypothetical protein